MPAPFPAKGDNFETVGRRFARPISPDELKQRVVSSVVRQAALDAFDAKPSIGFQRSFDAALLAAVEVALDPANFDPEPSSTPPQNFGPREKRGVLGGTNVTSLLGTPDSETGEASRGSGLDLDALEGEGRR